MPFHSIASLAISLALLACTPRATAPSTASTARADPPVHLTYLGVAGWRVDDGDHVLLVDPYFSRLHVESETSTPLSPDKALVDRYAPTHADAILVGHSHYDHLLDVPDIAKRSGATIVGTDSTLSVARAAGVSDASLLRAHGGETFAFGPFSVRAVRGLHSLIGQPSATIPPGVTLPMPASGYARGNARLRRPR